MAVSGELAQSRVDPVFLEPGAYAIWGPSLRATMPTINTRLRMKVNIDVGEG